jgi:N6-adenosine-specific RNA methylase IME4
MTAVKITANGVKITTMQIPFPTGKFKCIVADPPWNVQRGPDYASNGPSKPLPYSTMSIDEISALPVSASAEKDAHLYIWTINKYIQETYEISRAWGFKPSCLLTWAKKPHGIGIGGTFVQTTEHILFCRRGTLSATKRIDSTWWTWPRGKHSAKPEAFQDMVETVSPGPYLELFARRQRLGWTVWGNEV